MLTESSWLQTMLPNIAVERTEARIRSPRPLTASVGRHDDLHARLEIKYMISRVQEVHGDIESTEEQNGTPVLDLPETIIEPARGWQLLNVRELWNTRGAFGSSLP